MTDRRQPGAQPLSTDSVELLGRYEKALLGVFGAPALVLERGQGSYVWDTEGRRYLDLLGGIAVNCLGHAHPAVADAVAAQAHTLIHTSNFFTTGPQIELAERLLQIAQAPAGSAVYFANSGTEAIETALKIARRSGRSGLLAAQRAFHGRSLGALSLTFKAAYREPFEPLLPGVLPHVPYNDADALRAAFAEFGDRIGALVLEPIQGEAGVIPAHDEYLRLARELTHEHGALLVIDEIQTGIGRTGRWLAHQSAYIVPDVVTLAKGLGGGVPIGAVITYGAAVTALLSPGQHGTTFGGNPLACAAGLAVLATIESQGVLANVERVGALLERGVLALDHPRIAQVRRAGLLMAIEFDAPIAAMVMRAAQDDGFIVNAVTPTALRLAPSLLLTRAEVDSFVSALPALLARVTSAPAAGIAGSS